jgi:hypothetical protein
MATEFKMARVVKPISLPQSVKYKKKHFGRHLVFSHHLRILSLSTLGFLLHRRIFVRSPDRLSTNFLILFAKF